MKRIEAIIRKTKFEDVKEALLAADIEWFSYYDVRGEGKMRQARIYRGVCYDTSCIELGGVGLEVNLQIIRSFPLKLKDFVTFHGNVLFARNNEMKRVFHVADGLASAFSQFFRHAILEFHSLTEEGATAQHEENK